MQKQPEIYHIVRPVPQRLYIHDKPCLTIETATQQLVCPATSIESIYATANDNLPLLHIHRLDVFNLFDVAWTLR